MTVATTVRAIQQTYTQATIALRASARVSRGGVRRKKIGGVLDGGQELRVGLDLLVGPFEALAVENASLDKFVGTTEAIEVGEVVRWR